MILQIIMYFMYEHNIIAPETLAEDELCVRLRLH